MALGEKKEDHFLNGNTIGLDNNNTILEVKALELGYGSKRVCGPLNFSVSTGQLMAIVGINGIGKSTALRTLARFQPALSGEIKIQGKPQGAYPELQLAKKISVVLTEPVASKNMNVEELVALGRQPYTNWVGSLSHSDRSEIQKAMATLQLSELRKNRCAELSDGQMQRVLIARAMAQGTEIMLLDEPTTHLDLYHKVEILKILKALAHDMDKAVIYSTHDIELAIQICDKILILNGKGNPFGQPCQLIQGHYFEDLFPSNNVTFNAQTGSFKIKGI